MIPHSGIALAGLFLMGLVAGEARGQQEQRALREAIANQVAFQFGVITLNHHLSFARVHIDTVTRLSPTVVLWRGEVRDISHQNPFMLATVAGVGMPLRLGGFPAPRLEELSLALRTPLPSVRDAIRFTHLLVTAADPNGAREIIIPADEPSRADIVGGWRQALPTTWPKDTATAVSDDLLYVRRTVLSHNTWSGYGHPWLALSYTFFFKGDGSLLAWDRREGPLVPEGS